MAGFVAGAQAAGHGYAGCAVNCDVQLSVGNTPAGVLKTILTVMGLKLTLYEFMRAWVSGLTLFTWQQRV